ncbi:sodium:solute symporter [Bryobacter aggregatus]|uniref:sodium:solute symporter n=1 Tax=Bryobacter aggregatus TaxID=360054 RepID=UPI00068CE757|nr:sodium:solute symporter [Bryobacter aggregatus]
MSEMRWLDYGVILAYLIGITAFGYRFRESQKTLKDYFLGGRDAPWWAIAFSIVSAETSTLTVIGTPAISFNGNFGFLQVVFGYLLARIIISVLFLPQYFRGEMFTAYELMLRRFGPNIRKLTAGSFLGLRALAEGVRVFAISIVVSIVLGTGELLSALAIVSLTLFYTFEGGMTAVIWTDVIQMCLYVAGAILSVFVILQQIPGGWDHVAELGRAAHKFQVFDFAVSMTPAFFAKTYSFWAGVLGGCFLTTASHGTEQLMVQRLLSAKNEREARLALFSSWFVILFQFTLFLVIGVMLWVYYQDANLPPPEPRDRIYPKFIWDFLPHGVSGLVIAAILAAAMSNLSAALNALASTTVMDFIKPADKVQRSDSQYLSLAKKMTVLWCAILLGIALLARSIESVLEAGLGIASIIYGALLGVFLLGLLTKRTGERAAMIGMSCGLAISIYVKFYTSIAWTWYVLIGSSITFLVALAASYLVTEREKRLHV